MAERANWVFATDGRGKHPFGFWCERCGTELKIATPMALDKYLKECQRFTDEHKRCLAREGQSNEHN